MAQIRLKLRIGRTRTAMRGVAAFDSRDNPAIAEIHKTLISIKPSGQASAAAADRLAQAEMKNWIISVAGNLAKAGAEEAVMQAAARVTADLQNDLDSYAMLALRFFTSQQTSTAGRPLQIRLDDKLGQMNKSGFKSGLISVAKTNEQVTWAPLAKSTLRRKRANKTTYFVHTGDLRTTLARILPGAGGFFRNVINPGIQVTFAREIDPVSQKKVRVAKVEAIVATSNIKGLGGKGVSFMRGNVFRAGEMSNVLMRSYLEKRIQDLGEEVAMKLSDGGKRSQASLGFDVANKLENSPGRKQSPGKLVNPQRPWLEASMAYWVLKRLPYVLRASIATHMAAALKG